LARRARTATKAAVAATPLRSIIEAEPMKAIPATMLDSAGSSVKATESAPGASSLAT